MARPGCCSAPVMQTSRKVFGLMVVIKIMCIYCLYVNNIKVTLSYLSFYNAPLDLNFSNMYSSAEH